MIKYRLVAFLLGRENIRLLEEGLNHVITEAERHGDIAQKDGGVARFVRAADKYRKACALKEFLA